MDDSARLIIEFVDAGTSQPPARGPDAPVGQPPPQPSPSSFRPAESTSPPRPRETPQPSGDMPRETPPRRRDPNDEAPRDDIPPATHREPPRPRQPAPRDGAAERKRLDRREELIAKQIAELDKAESPANMSMEFISRAGIGRFMPGLNLALSTAQTAMQINERTAARMARRQELEARQREIDERRAELDDPREQEPPDVTTPRPRPRRAGETRGAQPQPTATPPGPPPRTPPGAPTASPHPVPATTPHPVPAVRPPPGVPAVIGASGAAPAGAAAAAGAVPWGPLLITGAVVGAAALLTEQIVRRTMAFARERANELASFSAPIALAKSETSVRQIMRSLEQAQRMGVTLADFERASSKMSDSLTGIKDEVMRPLIATLTSLMRAMDKPLSMMESIASSEIGKFVLGMSMDAFVKSMVGEPTALLLKMVGFMEDDAKKDVGKGFSEWFAKQDFTGPKNIGDLILVKNSAEHIATSEAVFETTVIPGLRY